MKLFLKNFLLICCFLRPDLSHAQNDTVCAEVLIAHTGLSLSPQNDHLHHVISVLMEDSPIEGRQLIDFAQEPSSYDFINEHFQDVYELETELAFVLTTFILKSSQSIVHNKMLKEEWNHLIHELKESKESSDYIINNFFQKKSLKQIFHNPYLAALFVRTFLTDLSDPNYNSYFTLQNDQKRLSGLLFYKGGDILIKTHSPQNHFQLQSVYIFFETSKRLYVFQIQPAHNISSAVLVFHKKTQNQILADSMYNIYLKELNSYFHQTFKTHLKQDEPTMIALLEDQVKMSLVIENKNRFMIQILYRIQEALKNLNITIHPLIRSAIRRSKMSQNDIHLLTLFKIAYTLGINIKLLLTNIDLKSHIQPYQTPLSQNQISQLKISLSRTLRDLITKSHLNIKEISIKSGVPTSTLQDIFYKYDIPIYSTLNKILQVFNIDPIEFLENISIVEDVPSISQEVPLDPPVEQDVESLRTRIHDIFESLQNQGFSIRKSIRKVIPSYRANHGLSLNVSLTVLLKIAHALDIKLWQLIGQSDIESLVHANRFKTKQLSNDYIEKAKRLFVYYLKQQMISSDLSVKQLSRAIGIRHAELKDLLETGTINSYYLFFKLTKALHVDVSSLLKNLENDIEQFEKINFDIFENVKESTIEKETLLKNKVEALTKNRIPQILNTAQLHSKFVKKIIGWQNTPDIFLVTLFKLSVIVGVPISQIVGNEDITSLINPLQIKREKVHPDSIKKFLNRLRRRIKRKMQKAYGNPLPIYIEKSFNRQYQSPFIKYSTLIRTARSLKTTPEDLLH